MDIIQKAILFGGKAIVSVVDVKELTQIAVDKQKTNDVASEIYGRMLAIGAFMSSGIKGTQMKLSFSIDGDGKCGKIIVAGETGGIVRGFIQERNPIVSMNKDGKYDVSECIGKKGSITVIKDFGLKNPYVGKTEIVDGKIDSDFAYYFTTSEGIATAIASGCIAKQGKILSAGAIIVQPMPNCEEEYIVILQDIVRNFTDFGSLLEEKSAEQIIDYYFGHFECKLVEPVHPCYQCKCSEQRMKNIIRALDKKEIEDILQTQGFVEIHCDFCNTYWKFDKAQIEEIFKS